jgi:hypothetical protein
MAAPAGATLARSISPLALQDDLKVEVSYLL